MTDRLGALDRVSYALFARHADDRRHATAREWYRGTDLRIGFDRYLARAYALSWCCCLAVAATLLPTVVAVPPALLAASPLPDALAGPWALVGLIGVVAATAKRLTVRLAGTYLRLRRTARRDRIRRSLPGVARYLHALSSGSDGPRAMLRRVAESGAYGEAGAAVGSALHTARLTGSLGEGLRRVARDTPARESLAPFLLKYREHARQGGDALANYLRMESRMLGHRRERAAERNADTMELLAELFVVSLTLPALLCIVVTVMSVVAPGLSATIQTPFGPTTRRAAVIYGAAAFVLCVGGGAALAVETLRPDETRVGHERPETALATLRTATTNPASALAAWLWPSLALVGGLLATGVAPVDAVLAGYVTFAVPVGAVALRRARRDDAKDREMKDFVHAVSGHVGLGRPLPGAVEHVAREVDLGPLDPDVADLAFNLNHADRADRDHRTAALDRFAARVGTPLAARTVGLLAGASDAGSESEAVFETLQSEVARLYHEKRALRSNLLVYVTIGWTTASLVVGIVLAITTQVVDSFAQLSTLSGTADVAFDPGSIEPDRARRRFYVVTQATVVASGWFAGAADRGPYAMLFHSGLLAALTGGAFAVVGTA